MKNKYSFMRPKIEMLSNSTIEMILDEAIQLIYKPGIKVQCTEARELLDSAGAKVHEMDEVVQIPEHLARQAIQSAPSNFYLYNRDGEKVITYGGDNIHFDPGSCGVNILDSQTLEHKSSQSQDLIDLIKIVEMLPAYDAQSTAITCNDIPKEIGDLYRLYLVLLYSKKPIVTGAFTTKTTSTMFEMLSIVSRDSTELAQKPLAVFDVCPTPPLIWSEFGAQSLILLAKTRIPAQIVSMPLSGATAPITLLGSLVQHAAETISGITIHQLARTGSPIIWGGAPAIFDMRYGTTPMGAIETAMLDAAYAQVGKFLDLPTHTYLGASDSKAVDAQAGMESGIGTLIGALAGVNMISGSGMLDFLACQSLEKLIIDAEAINMAKRMTSGIQKHTETLGTEFFRDINFKGDFLMQKETRQLYREEQLLPSNVIDRRSIREWQHGNKSDTFSRARELVNHLLSEYERPNFPREQIHELQKLVSVLAKGVGLLELPNR
jgi:trimethylamine--corrinoid protein Co-methyltransferase